MSLTLSLSRVIIAVFAEEGDVIARSCRSSMLRDVRRTNCIYKEGNSTHQAPRL